MSLKKSLKALGMAAGLFVLLPSPAAAQISGVEIGTSLANVTFDLEDENVTVFGIPSSGFGLLSPGVYASVFLGDKFAIEPQLGLIVIGDDETTHLLSFSAQADYFLKGNRQNSLYVFAGAGLIHVSDAGTTPKSVSVGGGYRWALGDRLAVRADGRYTHFTDSNGNTLAFTLSLGGLFGR